MALSNQIVLQNPLNRFISFNAHDGSPILLEPKSTKTIKFPIDQIGYYQNISNTLLENLFGIRPKIISLNVRQTTKLITLSPTTYTYVIFKWDSLNVAGVDRVVILRIDEAVDMSKYNILNVTYSQFNPVSSIQFSGPSGNKTASAIFDDRGSGYSESPLTGPYQYLVYAVSDTTESVAFSGYFSVTI